MDRNTIKDKFYKNKTPDWICPTCEKGVLQLIKKSLFHEERSGSRDHSHSFWEPEFISYVYSCLFRCGNANCGEIVSSSGEGSVQTDYFEFDHNTGEPEPEYSDYFQPLFFAPALKLIKIPDDCPQSVADLLVESFGQFFSSPKSAANSLRSAVEQLLTEIGIPRYFVRKKRRFALPLHARINLLDKVKYKEVREHILAIKWLGNAGSHTSTGLSQDDVLDGYELVEHVLEWFYKPKKALAAKAKQINKKKGPVKN